MYSSAQPNQLRLILILIIVVSLALHAIALWLGNTHLSHWRWVQEPVHSAMETAGSVIAFMVAYLLVVLERRKEGTSFNIPIAAALIAMGILDGLHALIPPGLTFVWLHTTATFIGGLLFLMVWLPRNKMKPLRKFWIPATATMTVTLGIASMIDPSWIPAMVTKGNFTSTAVMLNVFGGIFLLISSIKLIQTYLKNKNIDDLLFCLHCFLFGGAAIMFEQSSLWDLPWWGWHILRFLAYAVALYFAIKTDLGVQQEVQTQKVAFESQANASQKLINAIFDSAADAIVTINQNGNILSYNQAAEKIFGYEKTEVVNKPIGILMPKRFSQSHNAYMSQYVKTGVSRIVGTSRELVGLRSNGEEFPLVLSVSEFENNGEVTYTGILRDVTTEKLVNKSLREAKEQAEYAVKAKSEFLAVMSHEIRTPMNGVLGMLGLLKNTPLSLDQQHKTEVAESSAKSLLTVINDILDFSKIDAGKLELENQVFDLRKMIGQLGESLAFQSQDKGVELILDLVNIREQLIQGDSNRIRQILSNLLSNAIKFTEQGEIVLKVSLEELDNKHWTLSGFVSDTGAGIAANNQATLFDQFTQADSSTTRKFGGTGLGLAIVKRLCTLMSGNVSVTSDLGKGSTFSFSMIVEKSEQTKMLKPRFDLSSVTVLVVDDNKINCEIMATQIQDWGANVVQACSATEAYDLAINQPEIKIAFIDMQMPIMDGEMLCVKLKDQPKTDHIKRVLMTSMNSDHDAEHFKKMGFHGYFPKPATFEDILDTLNLLLSENSSEFINKDYLSTLKDDENDDQFNNKSILVVEDNPINQLVISEQLSDLGIQCHLSNNGKEAIDFLKENEVDLVLMDCQMPVLDGYETTRQIRKAEASTNEDALPIIALTANALEGSSEKCFNAGMNDFLTKPLSTDKLKTALQKWLIVNPE